MTSPAPARAHPAAAHGSGEYISKEAGPRHDRECAALTECDYATHYESALHSTHSDRVCTPLTVCGAAQWQQRCWWRQQAVQRDRSVG